MTERIDALPTLLSTQCPLLAGTVEDDNGCLIWQNFLDYRGYARNTDGIVSRQVYRKHVGPLRDDQQVHHECENPACVNPEHLRALTVYEHQTLHHGVTFDQLRAAREEGRDPHARAPEVAARYGLAVRDVYHLWRGTSWLPITGGKPIPVDEPYLICRLPGCENIVQPIRRHRRYCSAECRVQGNIAAAKERAHAA